LACASKDSAVPELACLKGSAVITKRIILGGLIEEFGEELPVQIDKHTCRAP
jgi:hypothetical protein